MTIMSNRSDSGGLSLTFPFSEEDLQITGHGNGTDDWWKTSMVDEREEVAGSFLAGCTNTKQRREGFPVVYKRKPGNSGSYQEKSCLASPCEDRLKLRLRKATLSGSKSEGRGGQLEKQIAVEQSMHQVAMEAAEVSPADSGEGEHLKFSYPFLFSETIKVSALIWKYTCHTATSICIVPLHYFISPVPFH